MSPEKELIDQLRKFAEIGRTIKKGGFTQDETEVVRRLLEEAASALKKLIR